MTADQLKESLQDVDYGSVFPMLTNPRSEDRTDPGIRAASDTLLNFRGMSFPHVTVATLNTAL